MGKTVIYAIKYIEVGMDSPANAYFLKYENAKGFHEKCERANRIRRIFVDDIDYDDLAMVGCPNAGFPASMLSDDAFEKGLM